MIFDWIILGLSWRFNFWFNKIQNQNLQSMGWIIMKLLQDAGHELVTILYIKIVR